MPSQILSTQPYKGTRDFYPEELLKRNYIFETWRKTLIQCGFVEYDCSVIENAEVYLAKSGEELGSKQLYSFIDKGDRKIALRPEMTPSLARIVSAKFGELKMPLRWFSIPNCFRYEKPQKGRLREFYQLNVDIIGKTAGEVDLELMYILGKIFQGFGTKKEMYKIMFNHRKVLDQWLEDNNLIKSKELIYATLDNWHKLTIAENETKLCEGLDSSQITKIVELCNKQGQSWTQYLEIANQMPELKLIFEVLPQVLPDVEFEFSPTIIRGLAYYTGLVLEGFNNNPVSPRALFGGGRYDDLLDLFGKNAPAIGVGVGDVPWADFLTEWDLWPDFTANQNLIGIMPFDKNDMTEIYFKVIPSLNGQPYDIDYEYQRSENKRYETLKKRGCTSIIKVGEVKALT
jgi:histidyl-tRNA synthetase